MGWSTTIRWPIPSSSYAPRASASSSTDPSNADRLRPVRPAGATGRAPRSRRCVRGRGFRPRLERGVELAQTLAQTFVGAPNQAVFHASACRAVSPSIRAPNEATRIGMSRAGGGSSTASCVVKYSPSKVTVSPRSNGRTIRSASPKRSTRWSFGNPNASYSASCHPAPRPSKPSPAHLVGGRRHLGHERGVAEARAQHERADLDAFGRGGEGAHDRPRLELPSIGPLEGL